MVGEMEKQALVREKAGSDLTVGEDACIAWARPEIAYVPNL